MKRITLYLISLILTIPSWAQPLLRGKVIDKTNREPLELANVQVANTNNSVLTDARGNFNISTNEEALTHGPVQLLVSFIGYEKKEVLVSPGTDIVLVELEKAALSLKEVIITPQSGTYAFNSISKIDLNLRPAKSSQELLRLVPGLFIGQHAGGGKAEQIFLRGFDIDHGTDIQISVDGLPVNMVSHAHGQGYADMHFIIPELVKNVDYGLGPYYAAHGNLDVAGYVDLKTINSLQNSAIKTEVGQFNSWRGLAIIDLLNKKAKEKNRNWYVAGEYLYSDGPFDSPQKFHRYNVFSKYSSNIGLKSFLSIQASTFSSQWNASGQVPERAVLSGLINRFGSIDDKEGGQTARTNLNAQLSSKLNNQLTWYNQVYYSRYNFNLFSNFTFFLEDPVNGDQINQQEKRNLFGYTSKLDRSTMLGNWNSKTSLGVGVRKDQTKDSELSHTKDRRTILNQIQSGDISESNFSAFAEQTFSDRKWSFSIGTRFDYFGFQYTDHLQNEKRSKNNKNIISPKINIHYSISPRAQVFFKGGKGFHSNDTRLAIAGNSKDILPAAYGTDLGVLFKPAKNLIVNAAVWYLYLQQEFVYVGDAGVIEPSGKTKRMGIDLSGRYQLTPWLFADANLNWTKPRAIGEPKGSNYIPLAPTFSGIGGLNVKATNGVNGSIRYRFIKNRPANENNSVVAKGYTVADASINYTQKKYEIGLLAENIFNTKWNEAQFYTESRLKNEAHPVSELHFTPGNPFNIRLKLALFF